MLSSFLVGFVAIMHLGFLILEMVLWTKPIGLKIFRNAPDFAERSRALAANQGLYNGFLSAGLIWSLCPLPYSYNLQIFFLSCVIVAAIFGAVTVSFRILLVQGLPALVALAAVFLKNYYFVHT